MIHAPPVMFFSLTSPLWYLLSPYLICNLYTLSALSLLYLLRRKERDTKGEISLK